MAITLRTQGRPDGRSHDHRHAIHREGLPALGDGKSVGENGLLAGREAAAADALQDAREDQQGSVLANPQSIEQTVNSATHVM